MMPSRATTANVAATAAAAVAAPPTNLAATPSADSAPAAARRAGALLAAAPPGARGRLRWCCALAALAMVAALALTGCRKGDDPDANGAGAGANDTTTSATGADEGTTGDRETTGAAEDEGDDDGALDEDEGDRDPATAAGRTGLPLEERFVDERTLTALRARVGLIPEPPPRIDHLLYRSDLREVTRYRGEIILTELQGVDVGPNYNAVRFAMEPNFGCSLQAWRYRDVPTVIAAFDTWRGTLLHTIDVPALSDGGVRSNYTNVGSIGFKHHATRSMYVLTCTSSVASDRHMRLLSERIVARLGTPIR